MHGSPGRSTRRTRVEVVSIPRDSLVDIPAFAEASLRDQCFFENAGGSYACGAVIARLDEYYRRLKVQPYYRYPASTEAGQWMDAAHQRLRFGRRTVPSLKADGQKLSGSREIMRWLEEQRPSRYTRMVRQDGTEHASPLVPLRAHGRHRPLFCVHPVGGTVACYLSSSLTRE